MSSEDNDLSRFAEAVADGDEVDWEREARDHAELDRQLRSLQTLSRISEFFRAGIVEVPGSTTREPEVPSRIPGYELLDKIGEGGMGLVYRARQEATGELVAVKLLPESLATDERAQGLFLREAILGSTLDHPSITRLVGSGSAEDGSYFFASELLIGETVQDLLVRELPSIARAVDIAAQTADGLAAAHARGVIHRDIKPSNLMLVEDGRRVKILDFGLARLELVCGKSLGGWVLGTAAYASPEQLRGEAPDARTDLWSLGVVLFELLAGRPPFVGDNAAEITDAVLHRQPQPIRALRPEAPRELEALLQQTLAKDSEERLGSASELLNRLSEVDA